MTFTLVILFGNKKHLWGRSRHWWGLPKTAAYHWLVSEQNTLISIREAHSSQIWPFSMEIFYHHLKQWLITMKQPKLRLIRITWSSGPSFTSVRISLPLSSEHLTIISMMTSVGLHSNVVLWSPLVHLNDTKGIAFISVIMIISLKPTNQYLFATCTVWACSLLPRPPRQEQLMPPEASLLNH